MVFTVNVLLTCINILCCDAGPGCDYKCFQVRTVGRFLSQALIRFSSDMTNRSFTSKKLYACLEKFLCFFQLSDRVYVSGTRCIGLFLFWSFWYHGIQMLAVLRLVYAIVRSSLYVPLLSLYRDSPAKSSPTFSVRPCSSVGRITDANTQWVFHGPHKAL